MRAVPAGEQALAPCLQDGQPAGGAEKGACGAEIRDSVAKVVIRRRDKQQIDRLGDLEPLTLDANRTQVGNAAFSRGPLGLS
jgi:hypothetical protein